MLKDTVLLYNMKVGKFKKWRQHALKSPEEVRGKLRELGSERLTNLTILEKLGYLNDFKSWIQSLIK